jgi:hypothetical protein
LSVLVRLLYMCCAGGYLLLLAPFALVLRTTLTTIGSYTVKWDGDTQQPQAKKKKTKKKSRHTVRIPQEFLRLWGSVPQTAQSSLHLSPLPNTGQPSTKEGKEDETKNSGVTVANAITKPHEDRNEMSNGSDRMDVEEVKPRPPTTSQPRADETPKVPTTMGMDESGSLNDKVQNTPKTSHTTSFAAQPQFGDVDFDSSNNKKKNAANATNDRRGCEEGTSMDQFERLAKEVEALGVLKDVVPSTSTAAAVAPSCIQHKVKCPKGKKPGDISK